jgi:hypothetical protein
METAIDAMRGAIIMGCFLAAVFFLRYWRESRDRFHGFFAAAMLLLAINWAALVRFDASGHDEPRHLAYVLRLCAFLLIVIAIVDKNRRR